MEEFDRIVIPADGSEHAQIALSKGLSLAKLLKRPVLAVFVIDVGAIEPYPNESLIMDLRGLLEQEARKVLSEVKKQGEKMGVRVDTRVLSGHPEDEIVKIGRPNDLIVIATHGRTGLSRLLLGSVAENVVRHAACPVLVVRQGKRRGR